MGRVHLVGTDVDDRVSAVDADVWTTPAGDGVGIHFDHRNFSDHLHGGLGVFLYPAVSGGGKKMIRQKVFFFFFSWWKAL